MVALTLMGYTMLAIFEFIPLYKQKLWRDFLVNGALFSLSLTIAILLSLGVEIPSPEAPIRNLITTVFGK